MDAPLLSIVIPHHDRPAMLADLIRSIPATDEIEIIVVDDHSTERPDTEVTDRPGLRLLHLPDHQRYAGAARNYGLAAATGTWIAFADSDDRFETAALLRVIDHLKITEHNLVYVRASSFRDDGGTGMRHRAVNALLDAAAKGDADALIQFYPPWCKFVRTSLIEAHEIRFDPTKVSNDVMFSALLCLASECWQVLDETVYSVREGNASLTSAVSPQSIEERLGVLARYNDLLREQGLGAYRVPAIGQLCALLPRHPIAALRLAIKVRLAGQPVLFTSKHLQKHLRRLCRRGR